MSLAQMTSYFPCTAGCMAANQNSFSGSFEMVQKQASQEWPLVARSGHAASTLFKFACAGPRLIDAYALFDMRNPPIVIP
jgi:hypothetical protein